MKLPYFFFIISNKNRHSYDLTFDDNLWLSLDLYILGTVLQIDFPSPSQSLNFSTIIIFSS